MSREEVARAALRSLGGSSASNGFHDDLGPQKGEQAMRSAFVAPSYQSQLPPLRRQSSSESTQSQIRRPIRQGSGAESHPAAYQASPRASYSAIMSPRADSSGSGSNASMSVVAPTNGQASLGSFFGNGGGSAMQMTASPTTSPSLVPVRARALARQEKRSLPDAPDHEHGHGQRDRPLQRPRPQRRGPAVSQTRGGDTPGPYDMPSLCSSSSSGNDNSSMMQADWNRRGSEGGALPLTPNQEIGMSFPTHSPSSASTIQIQAANRSSGLPGPAATTSRRYTGMASREARRQIEAIRRVAMTMHIPPEDIQRALETSKKSDSDGDDAMDGGEEGYDATSSAHYDRRIVEAVRLEEDRLARMDAQRAAYTQAARSRTDMVLENGSSTTHTAPFSRYNPYSPHRMRDNHPPQYSHSRTMPPLSPPPPYEAHDRVQHPLASPGLSSGSRHGIPSARMALESLTGGHMSPRDGEHGLPRFPQPPVPSLVPTHVVSDGPSMPRLHSEHHLATSRPLTLPERSYRSMDDYGAGELAGMPHAPQLYSPTFAPSIGQSPLRRSMHAPQPQRPITMRSPLIGSPRDFADDEGNEVRDDMSISSDTTRQSTGSVRYKGAFGPKRRATGGEMLDIGVLRSASPTSMMDDGASSVQAPSSGKAPRTRNGRGKSRTMPVKPPPLKLNHAEVMARLQRKVKERIAARNASGDAVALNGKIAEKSSNGSLQNGVDSSPQSSKTSNHAAGQKASSAQGGNATAKSANASKAAAVRADVPLSTSPSPRHSPTLMRSSPHAESLATNISSEHVAKKRAMTDDDAASRLGIEALLSAAAIADSPRAS